MFLNLMLAFDRDLYFYSLHASLSFPANRCLNSRSHPSRLRTCGAWLMQLSRQQGRSLRKGVWTISSFLVPTWHSKLINLLFGTAVEPVPVVTSSQSSASSQPSVAFEIPLPLNFRTVFSDSFPVTFVIVPPCPLLFPLLSSACTVGILPNLSVVFSSLIYSSPPFPMLSPFPSSYFHFFSSCILVCIC